MNINNIKKSLNENLGKKIRVTVLGMRNKVDYYEGILYKLYPNIFTILYKNEEKSFAYRDIITNDISVKYL